VFAFSAPHRVLQLCPFLRGSRPGLPRRSIGQRRQGMKRVAGAKAVVVRGGWVAVVLGLVLVAGSVRSAPFPQDKLPEPVATTFKTMFPNGTIDKLDAEEEDGVMVYDFEFHAGDKEKEADIAADGTMMESTLVITQKDIPAVPMKAILAAAKGAK